MDDMDIEPRVSALVDVANELPGVSTFSSCGGHDDWEDGAISAKPPDEFFVAFDIEPTREGWRSLDLLAWTVAHYADEDPDCDPEDVRLVVWSNGDPDEPYDASNPTACFQLDGRNDADPDVLAGIIALAAGLED